MKKKYGFLLLAFLITTFTARSQQIIFCSEVDQHNEKCKPLEAKKEWKLVNGQISFFGLLTFDQEPTYKRLTIKIFRNGDMTKPYFTDDVTTYSAGNKCVRTNLVITKKGEYHVQILNFDDDKVVMEGDFSVKGGKSMWDL